VGHGWDRRLWVAEETSSSSSGVSIGDAGVWALVANFLELGLVAGPLVSAATVPRQWAGTRREIFPSSGMESAGGTIGWGHGSQILNAAGHG
jgi:hypothetical protein